MGLARKVFTVSGLTLVSRVLGLVRDSLFAGAFGASSALGAFLVAFQLPNLFRLLFGEGALSAAFIPRYVQIRDRDPATAERFAGQVLSRLAVGLGVVTALAMAVAAALMACASGQVSLIAQLSIAQLPFMLFICVAAIMAGVLNGRRRFAVAAAAPVVLNLWLISTAWLGPEREVVWLPYAVFAAGLSQVAILAWDLRRSGGVPPFSLASSPEVVELRQAMGPVLLSSSVYQFNAFLDTLIIASVLGPEVVPIFYFANRLLQFPMALVAHGVATVAYPELASRAGAGWAATGVGMREAGRLLAYLLLPAAVGLLVTAEPLVRAIFQNGRFDEASVQRTVLVTQMLSLSLLPIALSKVQLRAFHAHRDQRTPMIVSLWMIGLNLALNLALVWTPLREAGLALATAISGFVGYFVYAALLARRGAGGLLVWRALLRPTLAVVVMAVGVVVLLRLWPQPPGGASGVAALRLAAAVVLGIALYLPIAGLAWLREARRKRHGAGASIAADELPG